MEGGIGKEEGVLEVVDLGSFSADFFADVEEGWPTFAEVVLLRTKGVDVSEGSEGR